MKRTETATYSYKVVSAVYCDCCGKLIHTEKNELFESTVTFAFGETSRDGGTKKEISFDFCQTCVKDKVLPKLSRLTEDSVQWEETDW